MTLAGSLVALIESSWSLAGELAPSNIRFHEGWFDRDYARPQVTVSDLANPKGQYYGTLTVDFYPRYSVNVWHEIPSGAPGTAEYANIESMRQEVVRIVNHNRHTLAPFNIIVPLDEGVSLHEIDEPPRILRYEITVFAVRTIS
jgi:hypothetical protein